MTDSAQRATARPWFVLPIGPIPSGQGGKGSVAIVGETEIRAADGPAESEEADAAFIVYAVNHIEAAEADLATAKGLLARILTSHGNRTLTAEAHTAARAFLTRHDAQPGGG